MPLRYSRRTTWYTCPLLLLALMPAGCGLSDYERQMAAETERLHAIDQQLDYAVEFPPKEETQPPEDAPPLLPVYIRPPKGTSRTAAPHGPGTLLQRYNGAEGHAFQALYLTATSGMKWAEFCTTVLSSFPFGEIDAKEAREGEFMTGTRQRVPFATLVSTTGAATYYIYFYHEEARDYEVAVIYQVASDQRENADIQKAINASLGTLVVGPAAGRMRYQPPVSSRRRS